MTVTGFGRVASVALFPHPETPEAGYDDLGDGLLVAPAALSVGGGVCPSARATE